MKSDSKTPAPSSALSAPLTDLQKRHAGRTKLLMKLWTAMHACGMENEWDAQEKISIEDLTRLLNPCDGLPRKSAKQAPATNTSCEAGGESTAGKQSSSRGPSMTPAMRLLEELDSLAGHDILRLHAIEVALSEAGAESGVPLGETKK